MNKTSRDLLVKEYIEQTKKASVITRWVAGGLVILQLYSNETVYSGLIVYFILDILQYLYLGVRSELAFKEYITIKTSNRLNIIGQLLYYTKIGIILFILIQLL